MVFIKFLKKKLLHVNDHVDLQRQTCACHVMIDYITLKKNSRHITNQAPIRVV
jgi:hypothetical protein